MLGKAQQKIQKDSAVKLKVHNKAIIQLGRRGRREGEGGKGNW